MALGPPLLTVGLCSRCCQAVQPPQQQTGRWSRSVAVGQHAEGQHA